MHRSDSDDSATRAGSPADDTRDPATTAEERSRLSRRAILRGGAATVPVVLTLSSGPAAALARSSNIISSSNSVGDAKDALKRVLCLDKNSVGQPSAGVYDLGVPPTGDVTAITNVNYYVPDGNGNWNQVYRGKMCRDGGTFFRGSHKTEVHVPRGALVSATALQSFAGSIHVTEI